MASDRLRRDSASKLVVLDSSAVLMFFEFSIDLENELTRLLGLYKIVVPSKILDELTLLSEQAKGKKKQFAKAALKLLKNYEIIQDSSKYADDAVLNVAKKHNGIIFSNDKELKRRAKKEKIKTIFLKNKNYLDLSDPFV